MIDSSDNYVFIGLFIWVGCFCCDVLKFGSVVIFGVVLGGSVLFGYVVFVLILIGSVGLFVLNELFDILIVNYDGGMLFDFVGFSEIFYWLLNMNVCYVSFDGGNVMFEFGVVYGKIE